MVQNPQSYIGRHTTIIQCTLGPDHTAIKCLLAFRGPGSEIRSGDSRHHRMGDPALETPRAFPHPVVPWWLQMPVFTQTTTPLRGELPLMPTAGHLEDIRLRCPAIWSWMAVLLQYWQDHMTPHLYGGPFLPHQRPGSHPDPGHQPVASPQRAFRLGVCGHQTPHYGSTSATTLPSSTWRYGPTKKRRTVL